MRLISLYIENFGKLSDFKYSFTSGLNTIREDNGYGKTTLTVFIKSMLYGLADTKKARLDVNDRKHYLPWNGKRAGGYLIFEADGEKYRVERTFMPKASNDTFTLYDEKSGKISDRYSENLGEELFGIDADGFERTVFLSEQNLSGKNDNKTVSAKLSDLVGADGDIGVMDDALELIEKKRKTLYKQSGNGELSDIRRRVSEINARLCELDRLGETAKDYAEQLSKIKNELSEAELLKSEYEARKKAFEEESRKRIYRAEYLKMKESISADLSEKERLELFFEKGIPTQTELAEAKENDRAIQRLKAYDGLNRESSEYSSLDKFFPSDVTENDFNTLSELSEFLNLKNAEYNILKGNRENIKSPSECPYKAEDVKQAKEALKRRKKLTVTVFVISLLLFAISAVLISIRPLIFAPVSAVFLVFGILSLLPFGKIKKEAKNIDEAEKCIELFTKSSEAVRLQIEKEEKISNEISDATQRACQIISKFSSVNAESVTDAVSEILKKRELYRALTENERKASCESERRASEKARLEAALSAFTSKYRTASPYPLEEIEGNLLKYYSLKQTVERECLQLENYKKLHAISDADEISEKESIPTDVSADAVYAKISELQRQKVLIEGRCRDIDDELSERDILTAERDELRLREAKCLSDLETLMKTKEFLLKAKDLLTSKYLSKTKSAFDSYMNMFSQEAEDGFKMDTSFSVYKNEAGTLRPAEAYSLGTRELYALAARLSLVDSLYESEKPFIILDDPFAHFDDKKTKAALSLLKAISKNKQIIYLTCSSSREV